MLEGIMLLWFLLTGLSVLYVAIDIRATPESPVLKWGFILLTAYIGPFGAFLYVLGCREPLPGLHPVMSRYVGGRCSVRRCSVWQAMAVAFWPEQSSPA